MAGVALLHHLFIPCFKMKEFKSNPSQTMLTISMGFLILYVYGLKSLNNPFEWALMLSIGIGIIGIVSKQLSQKVEWLWMKLAWLLSYIVPNILLSIVFYVFLFPIATLSKLFAKKDPLKLKRQKGSLFADTNKCFDAKSMENPW